MILRWIYIIVLKGRDRMKPFKNNKGVALVTVVLIFLVLVILLAGVMFASVTNQKNAVVSKDNTSSYYVAESGMNLTIQKIDDYLKLKNANNVPSNQYNTFINDLDTYILALNGSTGTLNGISPAGTYTISVTKPSSNTYRIRAIGTVAGITRTLEGTFSFESIFDDKAKAIVAKSTISMANNATITGPIASTLSVPGSYIDVHGCSIGEVYYPQPTTASVKINDSSCTPKIAKIDIDPVIFNTFTLPAYYSASDLQPVVRTGNTFTFPDLNGKQGYYLASLPTTDMVFNLGTGSSTRTVKLYIGDVVTSNSGYLDVGNISVIGDGSLMTLITVDRTDTSGNPKYYFIWDGNVNIGTTNLTKFQLVIRKGSGYNTGDNPVFSVPNNYEFIGSVMGDQVNVELGNLNFKGFIATLGNKITFTSNAYIAGPMWIYAPNADVSLESNSQIFGSIIANSVSLTSGAKLTYKTYTGSIPFELNLPEFEGGAPVPVGITYKFTSFKEV